MKTNSELQMDVRNAIRWESSLPSADIGVIAREGIITLSGIVDSYSKKIDAEIATKRVEGVKAVLDDIIIDYGDSFKMDDAEIAQNILNAWEHNKLVPQNKIKVKVLDGWVKLKGEVVWKYQEMAANDSIKNISGVKGVTNLIKVKSEPELKEPIKLIGLEAALRNDLCIDQEDIKVEVNQNNLKLTGLVGSLYQKDEAGRLACNTHGVKSVDNELSVIY
jgi:osmotically-inducible protein OsmY